MRLRSLEKRDWADAPVPPAPTAPPATETDATTRPGLPPIPTNDPLLPIGIDPLVTVMGEPTAAFSTQARDLQATICALRMPDGRAPASIAMVSLDADLEAAILAINVAAAAALGGKRTLLVDTAHSDHLHHRLLRMDPGAAPPPGDDPDDLFAAIRPSGIPRLSVLAMPERDDVATTAPIALVARLRPLANHFDLCLVDVSHVDDLPVAASSAEAAILVVRQDRTATTALKSMQHKLAMLGVHVAGTIMAN